MYNKKELVNLAYEYRKAGQEAIVTEKKMDKALSLLIKALEIFRHLEMDKDIAITLDKLGVVYLFWGNDEIATECYLEALEKSKALNDNHLLVSIYNNIGARYQFLGEYRKAVEYYHKAEHILSFPECREWENVSSITLITYLNLTSAYCASGEYEKSEFYLKMIEQSWKKEVEKNKNILIIKCNLFWELGHTDYVKKHVKELVAGVDDFDNVLDYEQCIRNVCQLFSKMGDYAHWEECLKKLTQYAKDNKSISFMMIANELWSRYYRAMGDLANYQRVCADYMELSLKHKYELDKAKIKNISLKLDIQNKEFDALESKKKSHVDPLTKTGDSYKLTKDFEEVLRTHEKDKGKVAIGIVDIDNFSSFNEKYGYLQGDACLKKLASKLTVYLDGIGDVYRLGGDRFVLLLPKCDNEKIKELGDNIYKYVIKLKFKTENEGKYAYITVSQGYGYVLPDGSVNLDMLIAYAQQALDEVRNDKRKYCKIIEAGKKDYDIFYEKYFNNLVDEEEYENGFREAESQEQWLMNLQQRSMNIRALYDENQRLIDRYFTGVISGKEPLTDELAKMHLYRVWNMFVNGKTDYFIMLDLMLVLENYFQGRNMPEEHIRSLVMLINSYYSLDSVEYYKKAKEYFGKIKQYEDYFTKTKSKETRSILYKTYFIDSVHMAENEKATLKECLEEIDKDVSVYYQVGLKEGFDVAEDYLDIYVIRMITNKLLQCYKVDKDNEEYKKFYALINCIYKRHIRKVCQIYQIDDRLYGSYHKLRWLLGEITAEECFMEFMKLYDFEVNMDDDEKDVENIYDRRKFHRIMFYIPEILKIESLSGKKYYEDNTEKLVCMLQDYIEYVKTIPKTGNDNRLNRTIYVSLSKLLALLPEWVDSFDFIFQVIIERDVDITIHSHMVGEISKRIIEMIYRNNPSLLIGSLGLESEEEVMENWPNVMEFVEKAGLIHDVGKVNINHVTKKQTRRLTETEFMNIKKHPIYGGEMVSKVSHLKDFMPIIKGHHKSYDDKSGYPVEYKYRENENPLIVNIIQLADCLDATTDYVGRAYTYSKRYDEVLLEFEADKGTKYNPQLVDLMLKDKQFKEEIEELTTVGREELCFELYNAYLSEE